jgi:predicted RNA-binding Zn ribbon-like protein
LGDVSTGATAQLASVERHRWTFKFRSNALCLNFVASMAGPLARPHGVERWTEPALLEEWLDLAGFPQVSDPITTHQLAAALDLREAIFRLATLETRGHRPSTADINLINHWNHQHRPVVQLDLTARDTVPGPALMPFDSMMAVIAADATSVFTGKNRHRIKECASEKCPILFVDQSRAGNRRWCSERPCGFQASSRAYRERTAARS